MDRAYSVLDVKSIDQEKREICGIATTPTPDRMGDIVEPLGVSAAADLPLLHQHDSHRPVGRVKFSRATKDGIEFSARLARVEEPPSLKERIDTAWAEIKAGLIRGVSIGFRALEAEPIDAKAPWGPQRFVKSEVLELSLVTVPANADATITQIRSIDRAATGRDVVRLSQPGGSGAIKTLPGAAGDRERNGAMKTLADQIAAFEATRAAKAARQNEIMNKTIEEGRTSDEAEQEEFDTLQDEIKAIDADLNRLKSLESTNRTQAKAVEQVPTGTRAPTVVEERPRAAVQLKQVLPKGTAFTRYVMAFAAAEGNVMHAAEIAKRWKDSTPEVELALKAAVTVGTTTDADWAAPLVEYRTMADEVLDLIRPATIIGRIPGLRTVPFNTRLVTVVQDSLVKWVGEAKAKPVGEMKFGEITLGVNKVAGIVVLSEELVRFSRPNAETEVRSNLVKVITKFLDQNFIDPAIAASAGVRPGSILNGVTGTPSGGTSAEDANADIQTLLIAAADFETPVFITTKKIGMQLGMLKNPLGQAEFAGLNPTGADAGSLLGVPVVLSNAVPAGILAVIDANQIMVADDGGVSISISREATLELNDAPADPSVATFNLWQNNCVGIRAERWITWRRIADTAVAYLTGVDYTGAVA
jgi:HK97 family phage major capsid protein/HK97 family phage prohead protease